jgi:hypothetical protein
MIVSFPDDEGRETRSLVKTCLDRGVKLEDIALWMRVPLTTVRGWQAGTTTPSMRELYGLARIAQVYPRGDAPTADS